MGNDGSPSDLLKSVGLDHLSKAIDVKQSEGPDGERGRLFWWPDSKTAGQFLYKPGTQTWIPSAKDGDRESGAYWIGFFNDSPPTEEDLRKPDHRPGTFVKLGDGGRWLISTPKTIDRYPLLNSDGTITWVVDEEFNWLTSTLQKRLSEVVESIGDDGKMYHTFVINDDWQFMVRVLQINYRITPEIVARLKLLSLNATRELVAALTGYPLEGSSITLT